MVVVVVVLRLSSLDLSSVTGDAAEISAFELGVRALVCWTRGSVYRQIARPIRLSRVYLPTYARTYVCLYVGTRFVEGITHALSLGFPFCTLPHSRPALPYSKCAQREREREKKRKRRNQETKQKISTASAGTVWSLNSSPCCVLVRKITHQQRSGFLAVLIVTGHAGFFKQTTPNDFVGVLQIRERRRGRGGRRG